MHVTWPLLVMGSLLLAGCAQPGGPEDPPPMHEVTMERFERTMTWDGEQRSYVLYVPQPLGPSPSLLIGLHGGLGTGQQLADSSDTLDAAKARGVVLAFPDGLSRSWNAVHCCGQAFRNQVDDVGLLGDMISKLEEEFNLSSVGVFGHSNGAMMAYRLAAERAPEVSFVASVAGTIGGQRSSGAPALRLTQSEPVHVLAIHAFDDGNVRYDGGETEVGLERGRIDLSVNETMAFWRSVNGSGDPVRTIQQGVDIDRFEIGESGKRLELWSTVGGHGWPGGSASLTSNPEAPRAGPLIVSSFDEWA